MPEGCLGSASRQAPSTAGAPAQLHATICTPQHPLRQGCAHGCCFPHPWRPPPPPKPGEGWGCKGLRSPSMMPHLVLRPSTRLPFTWCSWSAPTTAKGIFSCRRRGACSPGVLPGSSRGHFSPTVVPRSQHSQSRHPDTHPNPVVQQPVVWVLVEVLLWVHADGVGLQVLLDLWDTGLELGSGGTHEAPWEPLGHLPSPVA